LSPLHRIFVNRPGPFQSAQAHIPVALRNSRPLCSIESAARFERPTVTGNTLGGVRCLRQ
jgi:hypothetical protein